MSASGQVVSYLHDNGSAATEHSAIVMNEGMVHRARAELAAAIRAYPHSPSLDKALLLHAMEDLDLSNYTLAERKARELIESQPLSPLIPFAYALRGIIAFDQLDYASAASLFATGAATAAVDARERGDSSYTTSEHFQWYWQALALAHAGRYDEATPVLEKVAAYTQGSYADDALFALGQIAETRSAYTSAIEYFQRLKNNYPYRNSVIAARIREAQDYLYVREAKTALPLLESTANLLKQINEKDSSVLRYEEQTLPPDAMAQISFLRGEALNQVHQFKGALEEFRTVLARPASLQLHNQSRLGAGWSHLNMGENKQALEYYNAIVDSLKDESSRVRALALLYRAVALKRNGERDKALQELTMLTSRPGFPFTSQALLESGQMNYEDAKFAQARKILERGEHESNDAVTSTRIKLLLGAVYLELQLWSNASRVYTEAEALAMKAKTIMMPQRDQYLAEIKLKRGIALCNMQSKDSIRDGITDLNSFLAKNESDERSDEAYFWLGEAYFKLILLQNAEDSYKTVLGTHPNSKRREEALYGLGWTYFRTKDFTNSNKIFSQLIDEFPKSKFATDVLLRKADAMFLSKQYKEAAFTYKEAQKRTPKGEEGEYALFQIGQSLYRMADYPNALLSFKQFLKSFPLSNLSANVQYSTAWIKFLQEQYDAAIDEFRIVIDTYSKSPDNMIPASMYYIATAYYNKGDFESAITNYKRVLEQYPNSIYYTESIKGVQNALLVLGKEDEAVKFGIEYAGKGSNEESNQEIRFHTIDIFYNGRNYQSAAKEYAAFLESYPDSKRAPEAMYMLAKSQIGMGDMKAAEESYQLLIKKYPESEFARTALLDYAQLKLQQSQTEQADSLYALIQVQYKNEELAAQAGFERAQIAVAKGDTAKALDLYYQSAAVLKGEYSMQARYRIGMYLREKNLYDSARSIFAPLTQYQDNLLLAAEAQYRIGELWMRDNNWFKAAEAFNIVKEKFTNQEDWFTLSLLSLGECYEKLEDPAQARAIYQTIIMLHPNDDYGKTAQARLKRIH